MADVDHRTIGPLLEGVDVIVDGTDNFETRFLLNDAALRFGIPWIYGGCLGAEGQTLTIVPGVTPSPTVCAYNSSFVSDVTIPDGSQLAAGVVGGALVILAAGMVFGYSIPPHGLGFRLYLLAIILGYFAWPWVKGGQTLGMRIWRLRVVRLDGSGLRPRDALLRFAAALLSWAALGLGFLWAWLDPEGLAWHDRLSGTRLVSVGPPKPRAP